MLSDTVQLVGNLSLPEILKFPPSAGRLRQEERLVFGVWCLVFGVWCLVFGFWFFHHFQQHAVFSLTCPAI
jgi:hypothetical protein